MGLEIIVVHPNFDILFPDEDKSLKLFDLICNNTKDPQRLEEFIRWHREINQEVIREVLATQKVDFENEKEAATWASEFLKNYDEKIRNMRNTSNLVFQRFQEINKKIQENRTDNQSETDNLMKIFRNQNGLLIGKLIFAYREAWFVARKIDQPYFEIGSIQEYQEWVRENLENIIALEKSLQTFQNSISKWKE